MKSRVPPSTGSRRGELVEHSGLKPAVDSAWSDRKRRDGSGGRTRVAIALGSNIGDREGHLRYAVRRLSDVLVDIQVSPFIETEPQDVTPQPPFLNGAVVGDSRLEARALFEVLQTIEQARGRERPHPGAPRTLDLDLILFGDSIVREPGITIPHPRFRERDFVLRPLAAIAAKMVDPETGLTIEELLARI